jgi:hypothetical protein
MTKRQAITVVLALLVTIVTLAAIPFLQVRSDRADRVKQAAAGVAFVHKFDCTYGVSLKELLASGAYSTSLQAAALEHVAHEQALQGKSAEAAASRKLSNVQLLRSADLLRQFGQIQPLAPGIPC